ncbi:MAG: MarR family transcriptional regulator, partial [Pseudomonadota bacterium]
DVCLRSLSRYPDMKTPTIAIWTQLVDKVNQIQVPSDTTRLALSIDRMMRRIHASLHPRAVEFDQHNVGPLGGMLLLTIGEYEFVDMQTVITALGRDKSQISRLIQRFERKGLIQREKSPDDRRVSLLSLTPLGEEQLFSIQNALTEAVDKVLSNLTPQERRQFQTLLAKV